MLNTQQLFINNLKSLRKKAKLTQAELSLQIDRSFNYINGIECGVSFPPPDTIDKICGVLKIHPSELFLEEGCNANLVLKDKKQFIDELSTKIKVEIFDDIQKGIEKAICEGLK